ncbi:MAG: hypothetical protein LBJ38_02805 [Oscillospiraceae bacterium]|jgi:hypothetical protein|nr:hypothetical protein [Oscillospiraceae bacterium]
MGVGALNARAAEHERKFAALHDETKPGPNDNKELSLGDYLKIQMAADNPAATLLGGENAGGAGGLAHGLTDAMSRFMIRDSLTKSTLGIQQNTLTSLMGKQVIYGKTKGKSGAQQSVVVAVFFGEKPVVLLENGDQVPLCDVWGVGDVDVDTDTGDGGNQPRVAEETRGKEMLQEAQKSAAVIEKIIEFASTAISAAELVACTTKFNEEMQKFNTIAAEAMAAEQKAEAAWEEAQRAARPGDNDEKRRVHRLFDGHVSAVANAALLRLEAGKMQTQRTALEQAINTRKAELTGGRRARLPVTAPPAIATDP